MAIKIDRPEEVFLETNSPITEKMVGQKYGRLTILKVLGSRVSKKGFKSPMVSAKCDCGSVHNYIATKIRTGYTKSCGCFQAQNSSRLHTKHGQKSPKHGKRGTMLYARWRSMFDRVRSDENYAHVSISERWQGDDGFVNFCQDIGPMPTPKHTVDRYPNKTGNYEPGNVRWATMLQQMQNLTKNVNFEYKGEVLCLSEIARREGLRPNELSRRIRVLKLSLGDALAYIPMKTNKKWKK